MSLKYYSWVLSQVWWLVIKSCITTLFNIGNNPIYFLINNTFFLFSLYSWWLLSTVHSLKPTEDTVFHICCIVHLRHGKRLATLGTLEKKASVLTLYKMGESCCISPILEEKRSIITLYLSTETCKPLHKFEENASPSNPAVNAVIKYRIYFQFQTLLSSVYSFSIYLYLGCLHTVNIVYLSLTFILRKEGCTSIRVCVLLRYLQYNEQEKYCNMTSWENEFATWEKFEAKPYINMQRTQLKMFHVVVHCVWLQHTQTEQLYLENLMANIFSILHDHRNVVSFFNVPQSHSLVLREKSNYTNTA